MPRAPAQKVRAAYQRVFEALIDVFEINAATDDDTVAEAGNQISSRERGLAIAATCVGAMVLARTIEDSDLTDEICDAVRAFAAVEFGRAAGAENLAGSTAIVGAQLQ